MLVAGEQLHEADGALTFAVTQRRPAVALAQGRGQQRLILLDDDVVAGRLHPDNSTRGRTVCIGRITLVGEFLLQ